MKKITTKNGATYRIRKFGGGLYRIQQKVGSSWFNEGGAYPLDQAEEILNRLEAGEAASVAFA